jgi:hypothetical protein
MNQSGSGPAVTFDWRDIWLNAHLLDVVARRGLHHINEIERDWQQRRRSAGYDGRLRPMLEQALKQCERERSDG